MSVLTARRAGAVALAAIAALAFAGPASAANNRTGTVGVGSPLNWNGGGTSANVTYIFDCGATTPHDWCDGTKLNVNKLDPITNQPTSAPLTITMTPSANSDYDLYVYEDLNNDGVVDDYGEAITAPAPDDPTFIGYIFGMTETIVIPNPKANYIVEVNGFLAVNGTFTAKATFGTVPAARRATRTTRAAKRTRIARSKRAHR